jgi:hypothetical protein
MQKINYSSRNFVDYRVDLVNYIKQYYPSLLSDFNDSSVGMMLIELNAAIGDNLSFQVDRAYQETSVDYAQERESLISLGRNLGLKVPGKKPAITIVDFSVTVPTKGDKFDLSYAPIVKRGAKVSGGGKIFETTDDIDFASPFTTGGIPNRLVIPNMDSNQNILNYTLVKREVVLNGSSKIFKKVITSEDVKPFSEVVLPDNDILSIESVILLEGTNFTNPPTHKELYDFNNRWFEVDALAEDKIFIKDDSKFSDNSGVLPGKWTRIDQRFIREITNKGFTKLVFGGGQTDVGSLKNFSADNSLIDRIGDFINNTSLGRTLLPNHTLFVQYRVGGGKNSNIGPNILKSVGSADVYVNGSDNAKNSAVKASLTVNNPIPALGGKDEPSIEELRYLIKYNFGSQNRCVVLKDYQARLALMPSTFGVPFRSFAHEEQNKVVISVLGLDRNGKLTNESTNTLKENISSYLSDFKMMNDYVRVVDGKIFNIGFDIDLFTDKEAPKSQVISNAVKAISEYMDINKCQMGDSIYLSKLIEIINNINGVINVVDIRVYNKVGEGKYSMNEVGQEFIDDTTRQINVMGEFTLFGESNGMFEVKYPETDIRIRVKN